MFNRIAQTITLKDERTLGFAEYGDPEGKPLFYFCGGNSSRLEAQWFDAIAGDLGVRLVATDRPGFGLSDFQPRRRFLDWPDDIVQLADALQIEKFSVLGLSGGSPHVCAVANKIPERVVKAGIVSGDAPMQIPGIKKGMGIPFRLMWFSAQHIPWLHRQIEGNQAQGVYKKPENLLKQMNMGLPQPDKDLFEKRPDVPEIFIRSMQECYRNGPQGAIWEGRMYTRDWGFDLGNITVPVHIWHGDVDLLAPLGFGEYLAAAIPGCQFNLMSDEGHFSLINNHSEVVFRTLV